MLGRELCFSDEGARHAPVLLLIGSLGSTRAMWDALMPALLTELRVVRVELWGHGGSEVPNGQFSMTDLAHDVLDVLDDLSIAHMHVAGVSLGGMVALEMAAHHAERITSATLICTSARLPGRRAFAKRAALVREAGMKAVAAPVVERWLTPQYAATHANEVAALVAMVESIDATGYAACCEAIAQWDGLDELASIAAPTCVVVGAQDRGVTPANGYLLAESIAKSRLVVLEDAAHVPALEQPQALAQVILSHVLGREFVPSPSSSEDTETLLERSRQGQAIRRAVLGDAHVDRATQQTTSFTAPFQELVTWYPWGSIWSRPGLSRAERSMITLSVLAALGHHDEFVMHVRAALRNGLSLVKMQETLLHLSVYAGVPVANHAFALASQVLREAGLVDAKTDKAGE